MSPGEVSNHDTAPARRPLTRSHPRRSQLRLIPEAILSWPFGRRARTHSMVATTAPPPAGHTSAARPWCKLGSRHHQPLGTGPPVQDKGCHLQPAPTGFGGAASRQPPDARPLALPLPGHAMDTSSPCVAVRRGPQPPTTDDERHMHILYHMSACAPCAARGMIEAAAAAAAQSRWERVWR